MVAFNKLFIDQLYVAETNTGDRGFIAFVVPEGVEVKEIPIPLKVALSGIYSGSFAFSATAPAINNIDDATAFVQSIYKVLRKGGAARAFIWMQDLADINEITAPLMGIDENGSTVNSGLDADLTNTLTLTVANGMALEWLDDTNLLLNGAQYNYQVAFGGPSAPVAQQTFTATLAFSGPLRGTFQFKMNLQRQSLYEAWNWGFQLLYPDSSQPGSTLYEWLPLAAPDPGPTDYLGFVINIDPTDVLNTAFDPCSSNGNCTISGSYNSRRTWLNFTGQNATHDETTLAAYYRTAFGAALTLVPVVNAAAGTLPARLVFSVAEYATNGPTAVQTFLVSPEGDFMIRSSKTGAGSQQLLIGGLQGTEFFTITPQLNGTAGDTLRFAAARPAYAPKYPFEDASPVKAPEPPNAPLLTGTFTTSWATLQTGAGNTIYYVAQPKGSALFGSESSESVTGNQYPDLFGHQKPGFTFTADDITCFPLMPYSGITGTAGANTFAPSQIGTFENLVVSPVRRSNVAKLCTSTPPQNNKDEQTPKTVTTPSGLLVNLNTGGGMQWNNVLLGKNTDNGTDYLLQFIQPDKELMEALQTGDLMLVAANAKHLGELNGVTPNKPAFWNKMGIGSWEMTAAVGQQNKYNDYKNIMIIKARKGKLYDPANPGNSLVANPSKWTQKENFAAPVVTNGDGKLMEPDNDQLVILSMWLQNYFKQATGGDSRYFAAFNTLSQDENWTGILFLRVNISDLPANLTGIMAGITNPEAFNAHHLAVEISPVKKEKDGNNAVVNEPSAISGLIYYVDPDYTDDGTDTSIAPVSAGLFDFRLLTLKVLFTNTAVRSFESLAQLTITELFNMQVTAMGDPGNIYHNILLKGSLQINDDQTIYSLSSQGDNTFYFDNNIIHKIQIAGVLLSTRHSDSAGEEISWFAMNGFIDYYLVSNKDKAPEFDVFSFGNYPGEDAPNKGLKFGNLGISMIFPVSDPSSKRMTLDAGQISFDTSRSTPRTNSLYLNFALDMQGLLIAEPLTTLSAKGYLPVIPDLPMTDMSDDTWYGLRFKLNMGSPGELAGKLNLDAYLLIAWSPNSEGDGMYKGGIGISLPGTGGGAKLISLQSVMKLSIGQIRLTYDTGKNSFLLMFTEIALKFLGMLKVPPNGSTLFYLFGNPQAGGKASGLGWYAMYTTSTAPSTLTTTK